MHNLPSCLPIYSLICQTEARLRHFENLVVTRLVGHGLLVAVVHVQIDDTQGDLSDDCFASRQLQQCDSIHRYQYAGNSANLMGWLVVLARSVDLILVATNCEVGLPGMQLEEEAATDLPESLDLRGFQQNPENAVKIILHQLQRQLALRPVWACILIGGRSSRMGQPKHLLTDGEGSTWIERVVRTVQPLVTGVVLSGPGEVPAGLQTLARIPDIPGVAGPLTGILSAMRWQPDVSWLLLACDMPEVTESAVSWLLAEKKPGQWGSVPAITGGKGVEPLFARYEPQCRAMFELMCAAGIRRISNIADFDRVGIVQVPDHLHHAWRNINTPLELNRFTL